MATALSAATVAAGTSDLTGNGGIGQPGTPGAKLGSGGGGGGGGGGGVIYTFSSSAVTSGQITPAAFVNPPL